MTTTTTITRWEGATKVRHTVKMVGGLGWERTDQGVYAASIDGRSWTLERRRSECGDPAGWWLFGPEPQYRSLFAGETLDAALVEATKVVLV